MINVSVPCRRLLDTEYRPLPRDGEGSAHGLQFITFRPEKGYRSKPFSRERDKNKKGGHPQQMPTTQI